MNQAERAFVERLKPFMTGHGFKYRAGAFLRKQPFGFDQLSWGAFTEGAAQVIDPNIGLRHDAVDTIVNRLGHIWGDDYRSRTVTVLRNLDLFPFEPARDARKLIPLASVEEGANAAAAAVIDMLEREGFAFFERYASVLACSQGLNDPVETVGHPLFNNFPLRAYYGVASAALAEPERAPGLVEAYTAFARENQLPDPLMYDVARDLKGAEGIEARLRFVAEAAGGGA